MSLSKHDAAAAAARRHGEEFKRDAVRLVIDEGYTLAAAAKAVGVSEQTLRAWRKKFGPPANLARSSHSRAAFLFQFGFC